MKDGTKIALGLGGIAAALGVAKLLSGEKQALPVPDNPDSSVSIIIRPSAMRKYPHRRVPLAPNTPVDEGHSADIIVTVKNISTQGGVAVAATLTTKITMSTTDGTVILPVQSHAENYGPNESKSYTHAGVVPIGKAGQSVNGNVSVFDPNNVQITTATGSAPITAMLANIFGAVIAWTALGYFQLLTDGQSVPYGEDVKIGFDWQNKSHSSVTGHAALKVIYPDGSIANPTAYQGQDTPAPIDFIVTTPGGVRFNSFKASQTGTYTLVLSLTCLGVIIGTAAYSIVVTVPPIIYGATVVIG